MSAYVHCQLAVVCIFRSIVRLQTSHAAPVAPGMTLDRVCMSLEACFDSGMGYVALSRGRELQGIQLLSWAEHRIRADPTVIQFYQSLPRLLAEAQCRLPL